MDQGRWRQIQRQGEQDCPGWGEARLQPQQSSTLLGECRGDGELHGEGQRGRSGRGTGPEPEKVERTRYRQAMGADAEPWRVRGVLIPKGLGWGPGGNLARNR